MTPLSRNSQKRLEHKENKTEYKKTTRKPHIERGLLSLFAVVYDKMINSIVSLLRSKLPLHIKE